METGKVTYQHDQETLHGFLAMEASQQNPKPAVLVFHDWSGRNDFACQKAKMLCEMGYIGFAVDVFGQGRIGETTEEKANLIKPFVEDRAHLAARITAAYETLAAMPEVNPNKIAAIGFCFGGLCALDLARLGTKLQGVISFHGLLNRPDNTPILPIPAKVLVLHGYEDPMVTPEDVDNFCIEMTKAGADWQVHQYGHTQHAFTNPVAHDHQMGTVYNALAEKRSLQSMQNFLEEIFS